MGYREDSGKQQEIQSSLRSIIRSSDGWLARLKRRESRARFATSFLTSLLVFFASGTAFFAFVITQYGWSYLRILFHDRTLAYSTAGAILFVGLFTGLSTYFLLGRRHDTRLKELSSLVSEMKKIDAEGQKASSDAAEGITKYALSLADEVMSLLPEMTRQRDPDALLSGLVAFVVLSIALQNLVWATPVGVAVWLLVRFVSRKRYKDEISKFEEQRRAFEQRKKDFLETL